MNKHGEMIDESMIYPFAPDYDEEQALIHFSKLMMKYPNEHVVWMIKPETRKSIQSLLDKFQQRYPDLPWALHGIPNLLSHLLVKTKTPQTEDVIKIGLFAQKPAEIWANINCLDLISPLFKNLPHAQIQDLWTSLLQEHLLFSGLDIQKAPPALLKAAQLFSHEEIKKIVDSRATHPFKSKACLQALLEKSEQEFAPISVFIRVENSTNEFDNSFFLNEDKEYIDSLCQQLELHHLAELLNYPSFKLKTPETPQLNRLKKLLQIYQQFNKHAAIYNKKTYPILDQIPKHHPFFGLVTKIMPYGAFIDLGYGLEGLLHHSAFIHGLTPDPKLMLNEGDTIKVEWLNYDANQKRLSLKYHGDYFIPKTDMPKKTLLKPQKEHAAQKNPKITANQHKKTGSLSNAPTAMALAFAKLKEPSSDNK
jgi:transcriptional accessory protein Tex/SPT6